jgi:MYXO-CTERM domain-containing protein
VIPSDRQVAWQGHVGVENGIADRTTIRDCVASDGAHADGSDTAAAIQSCIDNTPEEGVAFLPAGTYVLGASLRLRSGRTLRGAGMQQTVLLAGDLRAAVIIGEQGGARTAVDLAAGTTKGSAQLVLEDASGIAVGDYLRVDELNDAGLPVSEQGYGRCTWCGRENGTRVRGQLVRVTATDGDGRTITVVPPLYFTFSADNQPQVQRLAGSGPGGISVERAGLERLTVKNDWQPSRVRGTNGRQYSAFRDHSASEANRPTTGASWVEYWVETGADGASAPAWQSGTSYSGDYGEQRIPVDAASAANCWIREVHIETCGKRCIQLYRDIYRLEIRDSHLAGCIDRYNSDNCYGTLIGAYASGVLVENNIFESLADGPMLAWSASGNVVAYNYVYDAHRTKSQRTWFTAIGAAHHGAHTAFNLWEGNELEAAYFDQYWGSHSHNTLFRNRILGRYMVDGIADEGALQAVHVLSTERHVRYQTYVGNVLGSSGYHDTYERNAVDCPNGHADRLIYRTGYASSGNCLGSEADPQVFATMLRHLNYDYLNGAIKSCGDPGEPPCQGGDGSQHLPESLYLPGKPAWFAGCTWPPVDPMGPAVADLPAKLRFRGERCPDPPAGDGSTSDGPLSDGRPGDGPPSDGGTADGGASASDGGVPEALSSGCGCQLRGKEPAGFGALLLGLGLAAWRRRRRGD